MTETDVREQKERKEKFYLITDPQVFGAGESNKGLITFLHNTCKYTW